MRIKIAVWRSLSKELKLALLELFVNPSYEQIKAAS